MVLVQRQTHKSMRQNKEPRNKPMYIWSINLFQRRQEYTMGKKKKKKKKKVYSMNGVGKTGKLHVKEQN